MHTRFARSVGQPTIASHMTTEPTGRLGFIAWFLLIYFGCNVLTNVAFGFVSVVVPGVVLLPICWQRMNDIGWSGWFSLLSVVPFVNVVFWLVCMIMPGNQAKPQPLPVENAPKTQIQNDKFFPPKAAEKPKPNNNHPLTMTLNEFSLTIPEGQENDDGYVHMKHASVYTLVLGNDTEYACDAEVKIDGGPVGTWRIESRTSVRIERPVHDTGRFTFYAIGTPEAEKALIRRGNETGLVTVVFHPGSVPRNNTLFSAPARTGGTGLSGGSTQTFTGVEALRYLLHSRRAA
jgi:Protein of unknown function (DUF805)